MRRSRSSRFGLRLGLSLAIAGFAAETQAGAPQIVGTSWTQAGTCSVTTATCSIYFTSVPIGKKLQITDISCRISHKTATPYIRSVALVASQDTASRSYFAPQKTGTADDVVEYALSEKANVLVLPPYRAYIAVDTAPPTSLPTSVQADCRLVGVYTTHP